MKPGWYPDPQTQLELRWWDGQQWTAHTRPMPPPNAAGPAPPRPAPSAPPDQPASAPAEQPQPSPVPAAPRFAPLDVATSEEAAYEDATYEEVPDKPAMPRRRKLILAGGAVIALLVIVVLISSLLKSHTAASSRASFSITVQGTAAGSWQYQAPQADIHLSDESNVLVANITPASAGTPAWTIEFGNPTTLGAGTYANATGLAGTATSTTPWLHFVTGLGSRGSGCTGAYTIKQLQQTGGIISLARLSFSYHCPAVGKTAARSATGTLAYQSPMLSSFPQKAQFSSCSTTSTSQLDLWTSDPTHPYSASSCAAPDTITATASSVPGHPDKVNGLNIYAVGADQAALTLQLRSASNTTALRAGSYQLVFGTGTEQPGLIAIRATNPDITGSNAPAKTSVQEVPGGNCQSNNDPYLSASYGQFTITKLVVSGDTVKQLQAHFTRYCAAAASPYPLQGILNYTAPTTSSPRTPVVPVTSTPQPNGTTLVINHDDVTYTYHHVTVRSLPKTGSPAGTAASNRGLTINVPGANGQPHWLIALTTPSEQAIKIARYSDTQTEPFFNDAAGLALSSPRFSCAQGTGSYTITNISHVGTFIKSLRLSFSLSCPVTGSSPDVTTGTLTYLLAPPGLFDGTCQTANPHGRVQLYGFLVNSNFCSPVSTMTVGLIGNDLHITTRYPTEKPTHPNITLDFTGAHGQLPKVGSYRQAALWPQKSAGGALQILANPSIINPIITHTPVVKALNCQAQGGSYTISKLTISDGQVTALNLVYSQNCADGDHWHGQISYTQPH